MLIKNYIAFLYFLAILLLSPLFISAQNDSLTTQVELGLRGRWQTGNLNQFVINPEARISLSKNSFSTTLNATYQYLSVEEFTAINDLWIYSEFNWQSHKKVFPLIASYYGFAASYKIDQSLCRHLYLNL